MKFRPLFTALLLATACSPTENNPVHSAVTTYLKQNIGDPGSYEPVRWGTAQAFTRRDSLKAVLAPILKTNYAASQGGFVDKTLASAAFKDSSPVGVSITHAYRAKNKLGALVLDSTQFVVYKSGKVEQL